MMSLEKLGLMTGLLLLVCACGDTATTTNNNANNTRQDSGVVNKDGAVSSSAWKICRKDSECSGAVGKCVLVAGSSTGMCSRPCDANNPCPGGGYCVSSKSAGLSASCARGCNGTTDCPTGMICGAFNNFKVCVPDGWSLSGCKDGVQKCAGLNLKVCSKGTWSSRDCDALCIQAGLGKAQACKYDAKKSAEVCFCGSSTCVTGQQKCMGSNLARCQKSAWVTATCNSLCLKAGYGKASSCGYDKSKGMDSCFCLPKSCTTGQTKCASQSSLSLCEKNTWRTYTCDTLCKKSGYGPGAICGYDASTSKETCACFNGRIGDKCVYTSDCKQGVCGGHGWCSIGCTTNADCGTASTGKKNYCMPTSGGGYACFPGCSKSTDCIYYSGAWCQSSAPSAGGSKARVCSS